MEFTELEAEILVNAWLLAREGRGQVVEPWAPPGGRPSQRGGLA